MDDTQRLLATLGLDPVPAGLRERLRRRRLARDETLFRQGDPARAIFIVENGRVALVRHSPDGRRLTLFAANAGESFAEAALFAETYHCDAIAESRAAVIEVPKSALQAALRRNVGLAEQLTARLARQVQELRQRLELHGIRSARERVWHKLLLLLGTRDQAISFDRPLKAVAAEIGLTHEAFYRALAALTKEGRIRRRGRSIRLLGPR
jgi:CRP/FNR family transcriptional regulator, dissimilatory nitrate respiration regulator